MSGSREPRPGPVAPAPRTGAPGGEDEARFRAIVQHATDLIIVYEADFTMRYVSPSVEAILGWRPEELVGRAPFDLIHPDDLTRLRERLAWRAATNVVTAPQDYRVRHKDGSWVWLESVSSNQSANPDIRGLVVWCRDITERVEAKAALQESEERYRALVEHAPVAIGVHQRGRMVYANPEALRLFGARDASEMLGRPILDLVHPDWHAAMGDRHRRILAGIPTAGPEPSRYVRFNGEVIDVEVVALPITYNGEPAIQAVVHDVTDRKRAEEELAHRASHDPLTDLPNRALLLDRLSLAIARCRRESTVVAVLFMDLDRFKVVNDSLGHDTGDELLVAVARHLEGAVRPGDTVARFGGDEFVAVCEELGSVGEAVGIAERIHRTLARPFPVEGQTMFVTASTGVAVAGPDDDPKALLRDADVAMYRAKSAGGSRFEVFDTAMRARVVRRLEVEQSLRQALDEGQIEAWFQVEVAVAEGSVVGFEALARWRHPVLGLLTPEYFLPIAEETGLIVDLGLSMLAQACAMAAARPRANPAPWISVNLSPFELAQPDLVPVVARALADSGLEPARLVLEITEGSLIADPRGMGSTLHDLRELGVRVAIDDFGTGYSSLGYLKRFPVDFLKIDRSFVAGLPTDPGDSAIVTAVVSMAHALGIQVVAEGVETAAQLAALRELDVAFAQGYYFARPEAPAVPSTPRRAERAAKR